jgi:hypothetical protein
MFYYCQKCILLSLKFLKVHIRIVQIINYISSDILSNLVVNKKVEHTNAVRGINHIVL